MKKRGMLIDEIRVVYLNNGVETGGFHSAFSTVRVSGVDAEKAGDAFAGAIQVAGVSVPKRKFRKGQRVRVRYDDPDPTCSYHGWGTFVSYVTKETPGYEYCAGNHVLVRIGQKKQCCCFPTESLTGRA